MVTAYIIVPDSGFTLTHLKDDSIMTDDDICNAEQSIEMQLAAMAQKLYAELLIRVPLDKESQVTEPRHLLQNAEDYLED